MRRGQALGDRERILRRAPERERATRQPVSKRFPFEKLGDRENDRAFLPEIVDREDVRMRQRRDGTRLALETGERVGVLGKTRGKDLDRDLAAEPRVVGAVHFSHSARADRREDFIGPKPRSRVEITKQFPSPGSWSEDTSRRAGHLLANGDR